MAHLLGSKSCLDSLAVDIFDVQEAIADIFARVGPVRFPSWKYPDKASSDLDIAELTSRYCYSKDEDHSKLSHIILFELLIDRLVLLLQALSAFCNHLLTNTNSGRPATARSVGSAMSVGLVVKKFWNKMAQLYQVVQRELNESANKVKKVKSMEETIADMKQEITMLQGLLNKKPTQQSPVKGEIKNHSSHKTSAKFILSHTLDMNLESPSPSEDVTLSVEEVALTKTCREVATQTYDTAFVPCEACSRTQANLLEVGEMVMKVCESQGLPSSLAKQKRLLKQSLLAAADVSRWAAEQNRDLSRINDHLDNLYAQIQPLQEKLSKSREKRKALETRVKELERCVEVQKTEVQKMNDEFSGKLNKVTEERKISEKKSSEEIRELNKRKDFLETRVDRTEREVEKWSAAHSKLESQREQLRSDLEREKLETLRLKNVEEDLARTKKILEEMRSKFEKATLELGKMEAKNRSLENHDQALQTKHDALLRRIDELDQECEDLREKVMDLEAERDDLKEIRNDEKTRCEDLTRELAAEQQQVESIKLDRNRLSDAVDSLERDVQRLKRELRDTEEKMQMIVEYPRDLDATNLAGKALDSPVAITAEMEKQISSNNIRIALLEAQNKKLRHSIEKLGEVDQQTKLRKQMEEPVLLWNSRHERPRTGSREHSKKSSINSFGSDSRRVENWQPSSAVGDGISEENCFQRPVNVRQPRPPYGSKQENSKTHLQASREKVFEKRQARALSAKLVGSNKAINNMVKLSRNRDNAEQARTRTAADDASTTNYEPVNTFVCGACDKMFTTRKDLDIHRAFCYELQAK